MQTLKGNLNFDFNSVMNTANNEVQRQLSNIQASNPTILNSISSYNPSIIDEIADTPDSLQEAVTSNEVKTTFDLAKNVPFEMQLISCLM